MVKLVFVLQLREEWGEAGDALDYWRDVHAPIAAKTPGLRKYVQSHSVEGLSGQPDFLGYAELWWDSKEAFAESAATPEWEKTLADANTFADLSRSWAVWSQEYPIVA